VQILLAATACFVCAAPGARAAQQQSAGAHCASDALEQWYCAAAPRGSAVLDKLGRVVCAPGACVKQEVEGQEDWLCSSLPGGRAEAAPPSSPVCDGTCRRPEATECKKR